MSDNRILVGNDHAFRIIITKTSESDNTLTPATGLTVTAFLSDDGITVLSGTTVTLSAEGTYPHIYYGYCPANAVTAAITGKFGVREVFTWTGGRRERALVVVEPAVGP